MNHKMITYHDNGKQSMIATINKQKMFDGKYIQFHQNGKPYINTFYNNGKLHGEYVEYDINGEFKKRKYFLDNNEVTRQIRKNINLTSPTPQDKVYLLLKWNIKSF